MNALNPSHAALVAEVTALREANATLRSAAQSALDFWNKPRPTFGCNEQRKAELDSVKAALRAALGEVAL